MRIFETQLPGVGRRYTLRFPDGGRFVVLHYNDGTREVFWRNDEASGGAAAGKAADDQALFELTASQSRRIAEIFDGTYFRPVDESVDDALQDARIRWITVTDDAPVVGRAIGDVGIRSKTGATILAIQRGERTIGNPDADVRLEAGDAIVAVGSDEAGEKLAALLAPA